MEATVNPKKEPERWVEYVRIPVFWESCLQCGKGISAPTERKLAYLLAAHKYEKHKGPEPKKGVNY